jgi:hypothetical protein
MSLAQRSCWDMAGRLQLPTAISLARSRKMEEWTPSCKQSTMKYVFFNNAIFVLQARRLFSCWWARKIVLPSLNWAHQAWIRSRGYLVNWRSYSTKALKLFFNNFNTARVTDPSWVHSRCSITIFTAVKSASPLIHQPRLAKAASF